MKRILYILILVVLGTTMLTAQDQVSLLYIDGDMLQIKDGDHVQLQEDTILLDCSILSSDGTYKTPEGQQLRIRDGEILDMYGIKYLNENQYRYKLKKDNKGLSQTQIRNRYQNKVHYMKVDGKIYQITNLSQRILRTPLTLSSNVIVDPFGTYKMPNLEEIRFREGEVLDIYGKKYENMNDYRKMLTKKIRIIIKDKETTAL